MRRFEIRGGVTDEKATFQRERVARGDVLHNLLLFPWRSVRLYEVGAEISCLHDELNFFVGRARDHEGRNFLLLE